MSPSHFASIGPFRSLDDLLRRRAENHGDRKLYTFLGDGEEVSETCDYRWLDARARRIAGWLQQQGLVDEPVVLVFPEGIDYVAAFFGCLYAGSIATPANPPRRNQGRSRLESVLSDSGARCVLTNQVGLERATSALADSAMAGAVSWQPVEQITYDFAERWQPRDHASDATAFLQYTSGSTGDPKGVMVSQANLLENQRLITNAFGQDESIVVAGWLPIYHDMGLIGNILHPLFLGGQLVFMPPVAFLQKPIRWLRMIADYGATIAGGPDFAYDLCAREITPAERESLDLSNWQVAFNGSEPLHAGTLRRFAETFAETGFREEAFCPCFGMAETTLLVSGSRKTAKPRFATVQQAALQGRQFVTATSTVTASLELVGSGQPDRSLKTAIVDPDTRESLPDGRIGEVWVSGPTVAQGYWKQPESSKETFAAQLADADGHDYLRTGDLGVLHEGELFITGRLKDVIIVRGANHFPQDIERTAAAAHEQTTDGFNVVFGLPGSGQEQVALVQEVRRDAWRLLSKNSDKAAAVAAAIRSAVLQSHEVSLASIVLVRPGTLPRTSSGKRQRTKTKERFLAGQFDGALQQQPPAAAGALPATACEGPLRRTQDVAQLERWILGRIAERLQVEADAIDPQQPFASYGLDSLAAVRLSGQLSEHLGLEVSPTLAYDYPTPRAVAQYLIVGETVAAGLASQYRDDDAPLAIVGLGCRFPGASTVQDYWNALSQSVCSLGPAPTDRWPLSPTQEQQAPVGGYLPAIDQFDPAFFGISPREAEQMDPQQRLLLEVAWETLESSGAVPPAMRGMPVGVFVGVSSGDYSRLQAELAAEADPYSAIGGSLAIIANRLSYTLDFRGPSLSIDTACSSSLVALHQAASAIRRGDCDMALAGGVSLIATNSPTESLSQSGMLSSLGLSRAFCLGGDGFVRGEGCGLVFLKRLEDALLVGDRVYCVLRGTAVNQDGRSNGLTAPNGPAQQAVIRQALQSSGLQPAEIDYVEAHGTGTELGDPTEMGALAAVFGGVRSRPLQVSSAKVNVGHLEGAAGIAGLIKTCLSLYHEQLPPHPLFDPQSDGPNGPSPHIDWSQPITIPTELTSWPREPGRVRRAGVSSFGFGGTNAHAIVEEAPAEALASEAPTTSGPRWLTLSAKTPTALDALVKRYAAELPEGSLEAITYAANTGRASHAERLAVEGSSREELLGRLRNAQPSRHVLRHRAARGLTAGWLFGGQGGCRAGMGRELYQRYPRFAQAWDACESIVQEQWPRSLSTICWESPAEYLPRVDAQVALVAWQLSLAELWLSWSGVPAWVLGHSLGEYAAAVTAGVLGREEALQMVCHRARLLDTLSDRGGMLAVMAPAEQVTSQLPADLSIAAENGPRQTVVSGSEAALERFAADSGLRSKRLATSHAFHSALVDPVVEAFTQACAKITMRAPQIGWLSTLTGQAIEQPPEADYWARQMRQPVRLAAALSQAPSDGLRLELSPTPVLRALTEGEAPSAAGWREGEEAAVAEASAAMLWTRGLSIDYRALHPPQRLSVSLPSYPFERRRHWFKPGRPRRLSTPEKVVHPLLGVELDLATSSGRVFQTDLADQRWLEDHQLLGQPTLPAVAYVELALAAGHQVDPQQSWQVADLQLERPLSWPAGSELVRVQTVVTAQQASTDSASSHQVEVYQHTGERWLRTGQCRLEPCRLEPSDAQASWPSPIDRSLASHSVSAHYAACRAAGLDYGPAFQAITHLSGQPGHAIAQLQLPAECPPTGYLLPPPLLDAALQATAAALPNNWKNTWLPKSIKKAKLKIHANEKKLKARVTVKQPNELVVAAPDQLVIDVEVRNESDHVVGHLHDVELVALQSRSIKTYFDVNWEPLPREQETSEPPVVATEAMAREIREVAPHIAKQTGADRHLALLRELESLSVAYADHAVSALDESQLLHTDQSVSLAQLCDAFGIASSKVRLFERVLEMLSEVGRLQRCRDGWRSLRAPHSGDIEGRVFKANAEHPTGQAELTLLATCGPKLASVLRGEMDPLSLLFPSEGGGAADLYRFSAGSVALNKLVGEAVAQLVEALPDGRSLRVLEIGAGTGATTQQVLQRIGPDQLRYVFTDVAPGFLAAARQRLPRSSNLAFQTLDIERAPSDQGLELASFDVVIAANVLHATANLAETLQHVRQLLAPGGKLLLVEGTRPTRWLDLTFGMTDGWWRFEDTQLRPNHALLDPEAWRGVLQRSGFDEVAQVTPVEEQEGLSAENRVILASAPHAQRERTEIQNGKRFALVGHAGPEFNSLVAELEQRAQLPELFFLDNQRNRNDWCEVLGGLNATEIVVSVQPPSDEDVATAAESLVNQLLVVFQAVSDLTQNDSEASLQRLTLLTSKAVAINFAESACPASAGLWGLARAAARELTGVALRCIDVEDLQHAASGIVDELLMESGVEAEVSLRTRGRFVRRLQDASHQWQAAEARRLDIQERGSLDGLRLVKTTRPEPGKGEVLVEVAAAGLNFRDVLNGLGRYPGDPPLGAEFSGVIRAVGEEVVDCSPGDRVIGVAGNSLADFVTVPAEAVLRLPDALSLAEAATLPVAFGTAVVAIEELAEVAAETSVLIHSATGGVGMAALQLAEARGAKVFATASLGKQAWLRQQGLEHVYDSRSKQFFSRVLEDTSGQGVEVIVNTLGEEFLEANLQVLAQGGMLVDLTKPKHDLAAQIAERRPDVAYRLVDLAADWARHPRQIRQILQPVLNRVSAGQLKPLPWESFSLDAASDAFRKMQRAGHLGKLLLQPIATRPEPRVVALDRDDACVITGGLGDLGLLTAEWLAGQGVGTIALVGRSKPSDHAAARIEQIVDQGVQVLVRSADVSDGAALGVVLDEVRATGARLSCVVHSAGALDDGLIRDQTPEKLSRVFAAKVRGLANLHELTAVDPVKLFVAYSSVASVLGAPGQANHSAANAFMDALIARRRAANLPGLTINWGPWQDIGEAARRGVDERADLGGLELLSPADGLAALHELLPRGDVAQVMVAPWNLQSIPDWMRATPLLSQVLDQSASSNTLAKSEFLKTLEAAPAFRRREILRDHLKQQLAAVLGIGSADNIASTTAMFDLGLDSLTTIELKNTLRHSLGLDLPSSLVFDFPTIDLLADEVHRRWVETVGPSQVQIQLGNSSESEQLSDPQPTTDEGKPPRGVDSEPVDAVSTVWDDLAALEDELESWEGAS